MTHDPANPPEYPGQPESGAVFNPQSAYPVGDSTPPPAQPPTNPYQSAQAGYPPPQPYQGAQGYPQPGAYPVGPPTHPNATTALVLGLVSLIGGVALCGLPLLAAPFAWVVGAKARREIRESNGRYGGDGQASAGMVMGIIGCVLIVLIIAVIGFFVVIAASTGEFTE